MPAPMLPAGGGPPPVPAAVPLSALDAASSTSSPRAASELDRLLHSMHELAVDLGLEPVSATLRLPYDRRSSAQSSSSSSSASPRSSHILQPVSALFPSQWVRRLSWRSPTRRFVSGSPDSTSALLNYDAWEESSVDRRADTPGPTEAQRTAAASPVPNSQRRPPRPSSRITMDADSLLLQQPPDATHPPEFARDFAQPPQPPPLPRSISLRPGSAFGRAATGRLPDFRQPTPPTGAPAPAVVGQRVESPLRLSTYPGSITPIAGFPDGPDSSMPEHADADDADPDLLGYAARVDASLEDVVEEDSVLDEEIAQPLGCHPHNAAERDTAAEVAITFSPPPPAVESVEDIDKMMLRYAKFWEDRARSLRNEPAPPPPGEVVVKTEPENIPIETEVPQVTDATEEQAEQGEVVQGTRDSAFAKQDQQPELQRGLDEPSNELSENTESHIDSVKAVETARGEESAEKYSLEEPEPEPSIINVIQEKRSTAPDAPHNAAALQAKAQRVGVSGTDDDSPGEWPNFDRFFVPDAFLARHRVRALSREATRALAENAHTANIPDDWWLDANAYSRDLAAKLREGIVAGAVNGQSVPAPDIPTSIERTEDPIPGLQPHPAHHHAHEHGHDSHGPVGDDDEANAQPVFSCGSPALYREVREADAALRRGRPQWVQSSLELVTEGPPGTDPVGAGPDSPGLGSPVRSSRCSTPAGKESSPARMALSGRAMPIMPISLAAGSASLGLNWNPVAPRLSLPLKLYRYYHSIPATPHHQSRAASRLANSMDAVAEEGDEEMNIEDMAKVAEDETTAIANGLHSKEAESNKATENQLVQPDSWVGPDSVYSAEGFLSNTNSSHQPPSSAPANLRLTKILPNELDPITDSEDDLAELVALQAASRSSALQAKAEVDGGTVTVEQSELAADVPPSVDVDSRMQSSPVEEVLDEVPKPPDPLTEGHRPEGGPRSRRGSATGAAPKARRSLTSFKSRRGSKLASIEATSTTEIEPDDAMDKAEPTPLQAARTATDPEEDPVGFYIRKLRSSQTLAGPGAVTPEELDTVAGAAAAASNARGSNQSFFRTPSTTFSTLSLRRSVVRGTSSDLSPGGGGPASSATLSDPALTAGAGGAWFDAVHDLDRRKDVLDFAERAKFPTLNDLEPFHAAAAAASAAADTERPDPLLEIEKLSSLISSSSLPIPAFLRARGLLFCHIGRLAEAMTDLSLFLRLGDTDQALKDLEAITDTNKKHLGAFLAKARTYQRLVLLDHDPDGPLDASNLATVKLAIVNYSQFIKLKPECSDGYYQRACLFELENETVYANEDFKMVRQLDPSNEHAIHNLAIYSFQKQLWDDAAQAFTKLILLNPENGQAYLFRGRAQAFLARWEDALRDLTSAVQLAPDRADVFFYRGCLLRERNRRRAIEDFSTSVLIDDSPANVAAFYERGTVYFKLKKYELAVIDYTTVVELDPRMASAWLKLGIIFMRFFNEYYRALECFDKAIEYDPNQIRAYVCRGDLYQILHSENFAGLAAAPSMTGANRRGKAVKVSLVERAIRDYSKAVHLAPSNYVLYLYRGRLLLKQGRMKEATFDFHSAFELNSAIAQTFTQRVLVLSFQRKYRQIIEEFEDRSKLDVTTDPSLYMMIARARVKCGDNLGAIKDLTKALTYDKHDPTIYLQMGICYENLRDWVGAAEQFSRCISITPNFAKAYYHRGICKLREGNKAGVADLDKAVQHDSRFFEAYLTRASYYHSQASYIEGIEDCNEAIRIEPTSVRAYLLRGACKCKLRQYALAIGDFTRAINLDKKCHFAFYNRAVTYQLLEDFDNAIRDYSIVLLLQDDSNAYRNRGLIYWKKGDAINALVDLYAARDNFPGDARLHGLLALCLQKVGQTEQSLEAFSSAIKVNQNFTEAYLGRGNVYASVGNVDAAMRDYARVVHADPKCTEAYINMGYVMQTERRFKRAWSLFTAAITTDPRCTAALEGRAIVSFTMKDYFAALIDISKAIEIDPKDPELFVNRAVIYQATKDNAQALRDNKIAVKLNPRFALAHFNIANLYFLQGQWENAQMHYSIVLEIDPKDSTALINRSITNAQLEKMDEALADINQAVHRNPTAPEAYFNRAQLFQKLGRFNDADRDYTHVLKLAPSFDVGYLKRGEV
ncbi:cytochrome c oxidase subunit 1, partial [Cladochytrium tenue]